MKHSSAFISFLGYRTLFWKAMLDHDNEKSAYYMKEMDKMYGYNLFSQISYFFNKDDVNEFLYNKYKDKIMYSYTNDEHIINNLFLNEISILKVKPSNIRIQTNTSSSSFLEDLKNYNKNLFVCNFKEQEFFFISDVKICNKTL